MVSLSGKRYLVTGGAGFIGSHICQEIVKQGKEVVCVDNLAAGNFHNVSDWWDPRRCLFACSDISKDDIADLFEGVDVVFHNAASKCTLCLDNPKKDLMVNAWGSWRVFDAAIKAGVKKIVHASTGSVYGPPCPEQSTFNPVSFYGVSKLAGERYLGSFRAYNKSFRYSILRYFHVYGPRQESRDFGGVIPIFIRRVYENKPIIIYGDGSQTRSFTWVKDDVEANFICAENEASDGNAYNVGSDVWFSILDLAKMVMKIMARKVPVIFAPWRKGDIKTFKVDFSGLPDLGLAYQTNFEAGLEKTINWYLKEFAFRKQLDKRRLSINATS